MFASRRWISSLKNHPNRNDTIDDHGLAAKMCCEPLGNSWDISSSVSAKSEHSSPTSVENLCSLPSASFFEEREHASLVIGNRHWPFRESRSTYLLLTSFTDCSRNTDIVTGDFRPLNFRHAPFKFPPALRTMADGPMLDGSYPDQVLALYRVSDLPARFEYAARIAALQRTANRLREGMETMLWEARRTYARWRYGLSD